MAAVSWASQTIVAERWGNLALDLADRREWEVKLFAIFKPLHCGRQREVRRAEKAVEAKADEQGRVRESRTVAIEGRDWWVVMVVVSEREREKEGGLGKIRELGFGFDVSMDGGRMDEGAGEWHTVTLIQVQIQTNKIITRWLDRWRFYNE